MTVVQLLFSCFLGLISFTPSAVSLSALWQIQSGFTRFPSPPAEATQGFIPRAVGGTWGSFFSHGCTFAVSWQRLHA